MSIKIALLGFGTVGKGTYRALYVNKDEIKRKTGLDIEVSRILEKNPKAIESGIAPKEVFTQNYDDILSDSDIKVVVEMMGGINPATDFMLKALNAGKSVVTPNKAAVAAGYDVLHKAADDNGVLLRYEASVCGAIPVIGAINKQLVANEFTKIEGIVNGTTNYILTRMQEEGLSYDAALKQAQEKGFAEADPTADVEGIDAANKLTILMAEAFGVYIKPDAFERKGITQITAEDIKEAEKQNCRIKLIARAQRKEGKIEASVKPQLIPCESPLAQIRNEFNGILLSCNMADDIFLSGRGAGMDPTGSAVAGDIVEIAGCIK